MFDPFSSILEIGKSAIDKIWPDPIKRAEEVRKLEELRQSGDIAQLEAHIKIMLAQLEINKKEAESASLWVSGWRPAFGWVGALAIFYLSILYPLLQWLLVILIAKDIVPAGTEAPQIMDIDLLYAVITGMLGIGGMRTFDKMKGTDTRRGIRDKK